MNSLKGTTIGFIGRSGCGKGTQIKLLEQRLKGEGYEVVVVGLGAFGREIAKQETIIGHWVTTILKEGKQYPDWFASSLMVQSLSASLKTKEQILLLDGSPRRLAEAHMIDKILSALGRTPLMPIHLSISEATARARLMARGRIDDTPEAITVRLSWFESEVQPVLEYYNDRIININSEQPIETVQKEIQNKILSVL